jgi:primosomal protein N'
LADGITKGTVEMKCEHCGHEQASGKFCDNCGRFLTRVKLDTGEPETGRLADQPSELKCSKCGNTQTSGRFCDKCGMMLDFFQALPEKEEVTARCPECGSRSTQAQCRNCGIMIPGFPTEEG